MAGFGGIKKPGINRVFYEALSGLEPLWELLQSSA
jgi:hypothetical protein